MQKESFHAVSDSMMKSGIVLLVWLIGWLSYQAVFSIATSVVASVYFISMIKINVVNKHYERSWVKYFKSWFK